VTPTGHPSRQEWVSRDRSIVSTLPSKEGADTCGEGDAVVAGEGDGLGEAAPSAEADGVGAEDTLGDAQQESKSRTKTSRPLLAVTTK
jgi:hypothetical protein